MVSPVTTLPRPPPPPVPPPPAPPVVLHAGSKANTASSAPASQRFGKCMELSPLRVLRMRCVGGSRRDVGRRGAAAAADDVGARRKQLPRDPCVLLRANGINPASLCIGDGQPGARLQEEGRIGCGAHPGGNLDKGGGRAASSGVVPSGIRPWAPK